MFSLLCCFYSEALAFEIEKSCYDYDYYGKKFVWSWNELLLVIVLQYLIKQIIFKTSLKNILILNFFFYYTES